MTEKPLVSIIVPIYNAQDHIARCVESIRRQTYQNLEILLLNDGSKDVSLEVCRMYAKVDPRIVLIDKANSGVAATRNMGLREAKGKYLQFVDADDTIQPYATELLVRHAEESGADLVIAHADQMRQRLHPQFVLQEGRQFAGGHAARRTAGPVGHADEIRLHLGHLPQRCLQLFIAHRLLRGEYFHGEYTGFLCKQLANVHVFWLLIVYSFARLGSVPHAGRQWFCFIIIQYPSE